MAASTATPVAHAAGAFGAALQMRVKDPGPDGLERRLLARATVTATAGAGFGADRLFDGDRSTAWCVPAGAEDATLALSFERPITFDEIVVTTVIDDGAPHRPILALAFSDTVHAYTIGVEPGESELELGLDPAMTGARVTVRIASVDPDAEGTACLSELRLRYHGAELGPFPVAGPALAKGKVKAKTTK